MLTDPVNIWFSYFIFGGLALLTTAVAAQYLINLVANIKNRRKQDMMVEAVLRAITKNDDKRPN